MHGIKCYVSNRLKKQVLDGGISVLGGITIKAVQPNIVTALTNFLLINDQSPPSLPLVTVYRVEVRGTVYYCKQYTRVKKRNSYTIAYCNSGETSYGLIECFLAVRDKVVAVLHPVSKLSSSVSSPFCTAPGMSFIIPVTIDSDFKCCFVDDILFKCLFIDVGTSQYVVQLPSSIMFD